GPAPSRPRASRRSMTPAVHARLVAAIASSAKIPRSSIVAVPRSIRPCGRLRVASPDSAARMRLLARLDAEHLAHALQAAPGVALHGAERHAGLRRDLQVRASLHEIGLEHLPLLRAQLRECRADPRGLVRELGCGRADG